MRGYCLNPLLMAISAVMIPLFVRSVLEDNLTYNQAMQLANDSSNNVVTSLAFKLAEMKHHGQLLRMTPQESDKVAGYLYQKIRE